MTGTKSSVIVKTLSRRLDRAEVANFRREMQRLLETDQPRVILDFGSVTHLDSGGIQVLLDCLYAVTRRDGEMRLASLSPQAEVILEISRVSRFFEIFSTVEDAMDSFDVHVSDAGDLAEPWNSINVSPELQDQNEESDRPVLQN
jgi:Anti-anti-sigma regulatory factor (antagonist of anti-sigma factor)